jgi:alpha-beta hydrolase superfamily lysophospholipase
MLTLFFAAAALYAAACAYMAYSQEALLFPGDGLPFGAFPELQLLKGQAVDTQRLGQRLRYYWVPAPGPRKAVVLLFHGNRDGARERLNYAKRLAPLGCAVLLAEFPGYAGDPRPATQDILLRNALAMVDEARELAPGAPLILYGESLGTGPATFAAMRRPPAALVLSTPWPSMVAVSKHRYPWLPIKRLLRHPFNAWRWARHIHCPVLVLHGTADETIPYTLGQAQAAHFGATPRFISIPGALHGNLRDLDPEAYWGPVAAFINGLDAKA